MQKFMIRGHSFEDNNVTKFSLDFPPAKRFEVLAIRNSETKLQPSSLLSHMVKRGKLLSSHAKPFAMIGGISTYLPGSFRQLLHGHPFPVSQGPVMLADPRVDGSNPGRANQINRVSKSVVTARASRWSTITQYHRHGYLPS